MQAQLLRNNYSSIESLINENNNTKETEAWMDIVDKQPHVALNKHSMRIINKHSIRIINT